ncbi:MAG: hypothetical protein ACPHV3_07345 [Vibrio sp.]
MTPIVFQPEIHEQITELVSGIKKGSKHPFVTFIITEDALHIIGGAVDSLMMITQDRAPDCTLKTASFSYSATAFANLWHGQQTLINERKTIPLQIIHDEQYDGDLLAGRTDLNSFRYAIAQLACDHHLDFYNKTITMPTKPLETKQALAICKVADECTPYSVFEVKQAENKIQIERDNDIIDIQPPEDMQIDIDMAITPEAKHSLETLAEHTDSQHIDIYLDDDQVIFSDRKKVYRHDLTPLRAYREKQKQHYKTIAKMIVNCYEFKAEQDNFQKIEEIKKANQALLYITPESMYFASLTPKTGALLKLTTSSINVSEEQLYSVNLNALSKVKIKDITTAKQLKLTVSHNEQGHLKLGFHNDKDKDFSYDSVPLELAQSLLPELKHVIDTAKLDPKSIEQDDLFGFDDV